MEAYTKREIKEALEKTIKGTRTTESLDSIIGRLKYSLEIAREKLKKEVI